MNSRKRTNLVSKDLHLQTAHTKLPLHSHRSHSSITDRFSGGRADGTTSSSWWLAKLVLITPSFYHEATERMKLRMWTCRTGGLVLPRPKWQKPPLHPGCHSPCHQRATSHKPTKKPQSFVFFGEGGKWWKSFTYTGIQCFTNTAVKANGHIAQWSYELEWMLEHDTRGYSFRASVSPKKIPLSTPTQLV